MITDEFKIKVVEAIAVSRANFSGSDTRFSVSIGINNSIYSRIKKGETDQVLSDAKWISLGRHFNISLNNRAAWQTANTPVFQFITTQLDVCQRQGLSSMLVDLSDIGKTYAAMYYCRNNKNSVYIDCSQVKSKQRLIRAIAQGFGVGSAGRYSEVYQDLVFYLKSLITPQVVLDEAGDLDYTALLEIKALWNATAPFCSFYMMGADGLEARMRNSINYHKVGFSELFSRFGKRYGKVIPSGSDEGGKLLQATATMIIKANAPEGSNHGMILRNTMGEDGRPSLRRIYNELTKNK
jgi:predicted GNAT family acetyltransferase